MSNIGGENEVMDAQTLLTAGVITANQFPAPAIGVAG